MNAIVPRNTIEQIVAYRDEALRLYEASFEKIVEAADALAKAGAMWKAASPTRSMRYYDSHEEVKEFHRAVQLPNRDRYLRTARRLIDITVWEHIIETSDLESLMDKQAKDQLRQQMQYVPERVNRDGELINEEEIGRGLPPVSVENILATLEQFQADADMIFRRGLANVFSKLDRRFRSHDGFKIGSRLILDRAFDEHGRWCWGNRSQQDNLIDIERVFQILDGGSPRATYGGIVGTVDRERGGRWDARQSEHEGSYFKIRIFKNGNAHLWFTRDDLVAKINKILGEWYGEVIGDNHTEHQEDPLLNRKTTPAKNFGLFPTPAEAADRLIDEAKLVSDGPNVVVRILEPSAGTGQLAMRAAATRRGAHRDDSGQWVSFDWQPRVDCVEIQAPLVAGLVAQGIYNRVVHADFLSIRPDAKNLYDYVVMNPPFDRERDIDHVTHALDFLKPSGCLVAIMSAGTEFRETRKALAFRALMTKMKARWLDLPPGSFAEVGTYVNTCIVRVYKDGRAQRW